MIDGSRTVTGFIANHILANTSEALGNLTEDISHELDRQNVKWGVQDHPLGNWSLILMEEIGEMSEAILKNNPLQAYREIVQCMAVLVRIAERVNRDVKWEIDDETGELTMVEYDGPF